MRETPCTSVAQADQCAYAFIGLPRDYESRLAAPIINFVYKLPLFSVRVIERSKYGFYASSQS